MVCKHGYMTIIHPFLVKSGGMPYIKFQEDGKSTFIYFGNQCHSAFV